MSVDVAAIREWLDFYSAGYSPPRLRQAREWLAALCDEVDALRAENARLREAVALHRPDPEPVEIETFCDDPDSCDQWIDDLGCNGHFREMLTCQECGEANVDGELGYLEWPCSTARAAGLDGEERQ